MTDFNYLHITGVNDLPGYHAVAAFTTKSKEVFKEAEKEALRSLRAAGQVRCHLPDQKEGPEDSTPLA